MTHLADTQIAALYDVIDETRALFHRLRVVAEDLHGHGPLTASRRGVLESLDRRDRQTVPQLARSRPVSRQHIQALVNALERDGLVELVDNPAHKRSRLVTLTHEGRQCIEAMRSRERRFLQRVDIDVTENDLHAAATVLAAMREALERTL